MERSVRDGGDRRRTEVSARDGDGHRSGDVVSFNPAIRMNGTGPAILDQLQSLADTTRSRILLLLDRHELTVSELCGVLQLPQSTVSRHLKALADAGWIAARADGTSHLYAM